jgi:hypothetical protein
MKGDELKNNAWLRCEVRPGMFENEVAICITTVDGTVISFFIPVDFVKSFSGENAIRVGVVDRTDDFGVVTLPRRTFEGSNVATVPARALRFA